MIFVDTSASFAAAVATDPNHAAASTFLATVLPSRLVTSDYVLDEALTLFKVRGANGYGIALGRRILQGTACGLERVAQDDLQAAFQIFSRFRDKGWSFADCTSLVLMKRSGISQAMAFDAHFEQFGNVEVLPRRPQP